MFMAETSTCNGNETKLLQIIPQIVQREAVNISSAFFSLHPLTLKIAGRIDVMQHIVGLGATVGF